MRILLAVLFCGCAQSLAGESHAATFTKTGDVWHEAEPRSKIFTPSVNSFSCQRSRPSA